MANKLNLKIGYGGTQEEMRRLIADAAGMTKEMEELGVSVDATDMSFGNIVNAISVVQKNLDITGTTSNEAASTISGSVNTMKAAWADWLTALADGGKSIDLDAQTKRVADSIMTLLENLAPAALNVVESFGSTIVSYVPTMLNSVINSMTDFAGNALGRSNTLFSNISASLFAFLSDAVMSITDNLPLFLNAAWATFGGILTGLMNNVPLIIARLRVLLGDLVSNIAQNAPYMLSAAASMIKTVMTAIVSNGPSILKEIALLALSLVSSIAASAPDMLSAAVGFVSQILNAIWDMRWSIVDGLWSLISSLPGVVADFFWDMYDAGYNLISGIVDGLRSGFDWVTSTISNLCSNALGAVKSFFGIHSPSKVMEQMGLYIGEGMARGIGGSERSVGRAMDGLMKSVLPDVPDYEYSIRGKVSGSPIEGISNSFGMGNITINNLTVNAEDVLTARSFEAMLRREAAMYA